MLLEGNDMSKLLPWLKVKLTPFMNIETLDIEDIPEEPGVYVMLSDHTEYEYPWGKSQVYYIGESKNLRTRLRIHKRYCKQAISKPPREYFYARYEYAAHHGCNVGWVMSKTGKDTKTIENDLLVDFAKYYGAKPVANGQSGW